MTCSQTSINFYVGDSLPDLLGDSVTDTAAGRQYFKLQKYIPGANLDAGSDDLPKGTYKGSIKVSDLDVSEKGRVDGMVALSESLLDYSSPPEGRSFLYVASQYRTRYSLHHENW